MARDLAASLLAVLLAGACGQSGNNGHMTPGGGGSSAAAAGTMTTMPIGSGGSAGASPATGVAGTSAGVAGSGGSGGALAGAGGGGSAGVAGTSGAAGTGGAAADCLAPATLKEAGSCTGRPVGVALRADLLSVPAYAAAALEFNYVTPENEMKWDVTEPTQNVFDFTLGDQIVDFALERGMTVKGHTLVWHNQLPTWLTSMSDPTQIRSAMLNHIQKVMQHYKGKVVAWDVVNEAFEDDGALRGSLFSDALGSSFIEDAFKAAREADPDVKLYYNDYDIESAYDKADSAYEMVRDFVERGVPIDGVGMQMHTRTSDEDPSVPEFKANLDRLVALGLEVVLSEMDVRLCAEGTFEQQRTRYHDLIEVCIQEPKCTAVTIWGISDQHSFLNERTDLQCAGAELPRPLLWDGAFAKKPAYTGVLDALLGR